MDDIMEPAHTQFERLRPRLTAISRRILGSDAEAEDVVQDSYLKWHAAQRSALATPAAWLTTVVQHGSIDRLRRRARDETALQTAADQAPDGTAASPEDLLLRRAGLGEALGRLLAMPSPAERLALVLHEVFECDHADIARVLGTSAVNARQHLARARRRLRAAEPAVERDDKLCRELIRRFQAALDGANVPAMVSLLAPEQPVSVVSAVPVADAPTRRVRTQACANDACYALARAA